MLPVLAFLGTWEVVAIVFVALLLFGASRLPKMARSMGASVGEFKKGLKEGTSEDSGAGASDGKADGPA